MIAVPWVVERPDTKATGRGFSPWFSFFYTMLLRPLHPHISASVSVLVSKSLALHLLLPLDFDPGRLLSALSSIDRRERSSGRILCTSATEVVDPERVEGRDVWPIEIAFSMTRRFGLGDWSCGLSVSLRGIIFLKSDCGV